MKTCCCPPILFFLLASITANVSGTSYVTRTTTVTTNAVCAVMATGDSSITLTNCRRRRQYWIDVPAYIALNDDVDSQLVQYFNPTRTYQVEPTAVRPFKSNHQQMDYHPAYWLLPGSFPTPFEVVQPSITSAPDGEQKSLAMGLPTLLALIKGALLGALAAPVVVTTAPTVAATAVAEVTQTLTQTVTVTSSTKTIFISGCKPVPFPFSTCQ